MSEIRTGSTTTAEDIGTCLCGGKIAANVSTGELLHAMPMCPKFRDLDILDFLAWLRKAKSAHA